MTPPRALRRKWILPLLLLLAVAACTSKTPQTPPAPQTIAAVKLVIGEDGLYSLSLDALRNTGLAVTDAAGLSLSVDGRPVALERVGEDEQAAVRFYGRANRRPGQSYRNVYRLAAGQGSAAAQPAPPPADANLTDTGWVTVRAEEQKRYLPDAEPGGDRWFWTSLFAPADFEIPFAIVDPLPAEGLLRLRLWAESMAPVNPDHRIILTMNDVALGETTWDGRGTHLVELPLPAGLLKPGENRLKLTAPGDTGAPADSVLVDWAEVTYQRPLVAGAAPLEFGGQASGFRVALTAGRLQPDDLAVWDVTDPAQPQPLTGYAIADGALRFGSDGTARRYVVALKDGLLQPASIAGVAPGSLPGWPGGADVIVVTAPEFREALQPLIAAREKAGLRVAVLDAAAVYDAFSRSRPDPSAIRDLVQYARANWSAPAPAYLLLVGDASYDPSGYLAGAEKDIIPAQFIATTYTGWTASDVWYALPPTVFEGDGITLKAGDAAPSLKPVMAVGRLPAQTSEQVRAMVAKTLAYEQGNAAAGWRRQAILPADNDDPDFLVEAQAFGARLTGFQAEVAPVTGDGSAARTAVLGAFDAGVGLMGYTGHGSVTLWAQEGILKVEDVPALKNGDRLPVVFTVTCLSGFFVHPSTVSLGEALVRHAGGGAVAALVPSGAALLADQRPLSQALADALAIRPGGQDNAARLGDAVLQAQTSVTDQTAGVREVLLTFNLLGDPTLELRR